MTLSMYSSYSLGPDFNLEVTSDKCIMSLTSIIDVDHIDVDLSVSFVYLNTYNE